MFVRLYRDGGHKEVLFNVSFVSLIEVDYGMPDKTDGGFWKTSAKVAAEQPEARRFYRIHAAGEKFLILSNPDDPVAQVFEDIYKNAIKM